MTKSRVKPKSKKKLKRSGALRRAHPPKKYLAGASPDRDLHIMELSGRLKAAVLGEPSMTFFEGS